MTDRTDDSIRAARDAYDQSAAGCLQLLAQASQANTSQPSTLEILQVMIACTRRAKQYHSLLWDTVRSRSNHERQRLVEEIERFEVEHQQLAVRLDTWIASRQSSS